MRLNVFFSSQRRLPVVMVLLFLPWLAVVLSTAGIWAALNFVRYAILVFAAGYSIVNVALPASARTQIIVLALALGILAISALTAFWVRLGLPLIWVPALWLGLATAGVVGLWRDRASWATSTVAYGWTLAFLSVFGILVGIVGYATHGHAGIASFRLKVFLSFLLLSLLAGMLALMKRSRPFSTFISAILMGVLLIGFLSWVTPWVNYGMGREKFDRSLSPGEVRGLKRLNALAATGQRFATNKQFGERAPTREIPDYAYSTLAERPVLLGGCGSGNEPALPGFNVLCRANDLLFTSTNSATLRDTARTYCVKWLVARPGTDIALPRPLPAWLVEQPDCGDLKIYRID